MLIIAEQQTDKIIHKKNINYNVSPFMLLLRKKSFRFQ